MSKIAYTVAALLALSGSAVEASCAPKQVDKVNLAFPTQVHRAVGWGGSQHQAWTTWSHHPNWVAGPLKVFKDAGVNDNVLKYLNFAVLNHPAVHDIEYIAFFASGQQVCFGQNQVVSGADAEWRYQVNKATGGGKKKASWTYGLTHIDKRSMAGIFLDGQSKPTSYGLDFSVFDLNKTLVVDILDTSFQYPADLAQTLGELGNCNTGNSLSQNNKVLAGWKAWLDHHVNWANIKGFFGSGFSRGGCFVTRLAHNLFKHDPQLRCNAKLILETFDPVCHPQEWDKEVENNNLITNNNVRNPFKKGSQKCHQIRTQRLFGDLPRHNIRWLNTITGDKVVLVANAFCSEYTTDSDQHVQINDNGTVIHSGDISLDGDAARPYTTDAWYEETWVGKSHGFVGDWHSPQNPGSVSCDGSSVCGFGYTCAPNARADKDNVFKHAQHAAWWGTESALAVNPGRFQNNCHVPPTWTPSEEVEASGDAPDEAINPIFEERTDGFWTEYYNAEEAGTDAIFVAQVNQALAAEQAAFSEANGSD